MKRFATAAFAAAALLGASCAFAQAPAPAKASSGGWTSKLDGLTFSVDGGVTMTKKTGGLAGGEITTKEYWANSNSYRRRLSFSIEGGWMSSVLNAHRIDAANAIANYLAQTQGQTASASVKVPAGYGAVNARYRLYTKPRYRVYALVGGGFGVTEPKTTFRLAGTDVSGSVGQYSVTVGKDLGGSSLGGLVNAGLGATLPCGSKWVGDVSYRLTPLFTKGQTTVVNRINFGFGRKF